jgi:hypothetical protein
MKERCGDTNNKDYGGRGITICPEWRGDFRPFFDWALASGYANNLTIDRIDVNGNYEPGNCRWADRNTQANNTRRNNYITHEGITKTAMQWAREYEIPISTFLRWLKKGENIEDIPLKRCGKHREKQHRCGICGNTFLSHSHKSKYCSAECGRIGENKAQQQRRNRLSA